MGKAMYLGVSSKARKGKKAYIGVDGKARKIKKMYIGDANGKARLFWSGFDGGNALILYGHYYKWVISSSGSTTTYGIQAFPYSCHTDNVLKTTYSASTKNSLVHGMTTDWKFLVYAHNRHFVLSNNSGRIVSYSIDNGVTWTNLITLKEDCYRIVFCNDKLILLTSKQTGGGSGQNYSYTTESYYACYIDSNMNVSQQDLLLDELSNSSSPGQTINTSVITLTYLNNKYYAIVGSSTLYPNGSMEYSYNIKSTSSLGTKLSGASEVYATSKFLGSCVRENKWILLHSKGVYSFDPSTETVTLECSLSYSHTDVVKCSNEHYIFSYTRTVSGTVTKGTEVVKVVDGVFTVVSSTSDYVIKSDMGHREGVLYYPSYHNSNNVKYLDIYYSKDYGATFTKNEGVSSFSYSNDNNGNSTTYTTLMCTGESL